VGDENPAFRELLLGMQSALGAGVVLNTSFNIHGEPIVESPTDALDMFARTDLRYLFMENFLVEKNDA
jgi:carbamoyltransferase